MFQSSKASGILVRCNKTSTVLCIIEMIQEKMGISLHGGDAGVSKKTGRDIRKVLHGEAFLAYL